VVVNTGQEDDRRERERWVEFELRLGEREKRGWGGERR
jgi:hypothetical protein